MVSLTLNNLRFMKKIGILLLVFIGMVSCKNEIKNPTRIAALLIAAFTPTWLILNGAEVDMGYFGYHRIAWFLYAFIMLCSLSTFICFSQNVYPSEYQWNKKTYN